MKTCGGTDARTPNLHPGDGLFCAIGNTRNQRRLRPSYIERSAICGHLAEALLRRWLDQGARPAVVNRQLERYFRDVG